MKTAVTKPQIGTRIARVAGEALVIFMSVIVALVADDWRETAGERDEALRSLEIVEQDLVRDSSELADLERVIPRHLRAVAGLLGGWGGIQPDSLTDYLGTLRGGPRPAFSRAGFNGLLAANGLRLLENGDLRNALVQHYEVDLPQFSDYYFGTVIPQRVRAWDHLPAHVETYRTVDGGDLVLRTSWDAIIRDFDLEAALVRYNAMAVYVDRFMVPTLRDGNRDLLERVRLEIRRR